MGEEAKQEELEIEKVEKTEEKKEPKPPSPFVLHIDLHCVGCAKKIERSISKIRGVERVMIDMAQNQVIIIGVIEPQQVCARIMNKTKRVAKVLSPLPADEGQPIPEVVASQISGLTTVELSVNMHCEACAQQLKRKILKVRGVITAETDVSLGKVIVTGNMDANNLVDYVYRRTKKQAKIVPQPDHEPKPEEAAKLPEDDEKAKPEEEEVKEGEEEMIIPSGDEQIINKMMYYYQPLYVIERIPPPQLFSDENPNACCIT
ncbi:PREDICTED: heavy metal-associated isoprenylated plant protein 9-like [Nicotiana attenuata]|uniref:heavy metal-associated isoprenylated plant protein 9-like n=1 Tax=Nicotiana attenuata TaxID=49451 RepID=UPI0009048EFA|nr:PREDICTED: heavy metal-associated isoprenylated plant protein 9-like [Nicotiana attenuata]